MANSSTKLVNWKTWAILVPASAIGASLSLFRQYRDTGRVQPGSIAIAIFTFCVAIGIAAAVARYANRPEKERNQ